MTVTLEPLKPFKFNMVAIVELPTQSKSLPTHNRWKETSGHRWNKSETKLLPSDHGQMASSTRWFGINVALVVRSVKPWLVDTKAGISETDSTLERWQGRDKLMAMAMAISSHSLNNKAIKINNKSNHHKINKQGSQDPPTCHREL